jgi:RimJ/RimL family protein N-acetyltransferase
MNNIHLEELAMNAWPALQTVLYDGWMVRFANGYTKRANSVTPLYPGTLWLDEKIYQCEQLFQKKKLRSTFRLSQATNDEQRRLSLSQPGLRQAQSASADDSMLKTPTYTDISELDEQLANRGYERIDTTSVQIVDLVELDVEQSRRAYLLPDYSGMESWLRSFHELSGDHRSDDETHKKMLSNIQGRTGYMVLIVEGEVVTCGLGVIERGYLGIFDVITAVSHRNKGYGTELMQSLLAWGQACDADYSYLQVMTNNPAALNLYTKLGFSEQYQYWYRVKN